MSAADRAACMQCGGPVEDAGGRFSMRCRVCDGLPADETPNPAKRRRPARISSEPGRPPQEFAFEAAKRVGGLVLFFGSLGAFIALKSQGVGAGALALVGAVFSAVAVAFPVYLTAFALACVGDGVKVVAGAVGLTDADAASA